MEQITHKTDSPHPEWNESYYFAFFDKKLNIGGVSRIGYKPNKPEGMTFLFLFFPDGSVAVYHKIEEIIEYSHSLHVGGMEHNCISGKKWNYKFQGKMIFLKNPEDLPKLREQSKLNLISKAIRKKISKRQVKLNLDFNPINKVYEYSEFMTPESLEIGKKAGDKHWEQIAKIEGELQIGDKIYNIQNTLGQRDHTYGIRDWTGVGNWLYYVIWFNDTLAINPATIVLNDGRISTGGFIFKNGKNIPLKSIKVLNQTFRTDGLLPISSELEIIDYNDEKYILKAKAGTIIPVPFEDSEGNKSILVQSFGNFELDGTSGYGTFETLRKIA